MTPKLTKTTTAFVRVLSAVGALSVSMAMPSMAASTDMSAADSGIPGTLGGGLAQTLTRVDVQRGKDDLRVVLSGDGKLAHEVTRVDERRLMIDMPGVASAIRKPFISVNHRMLKQVRLGYHPDKTRVVLDLAGTIAYTVEPQGTKLLVNLREGTGTDIGGGMHPNRVEAVQAVEPKSSVIPLIQTDVTSRVVQRTLATARRPSTKFYVQPVQLTSEGPILAPTGGDPAGEVSTPKDDLVVGETHYVGRRISLDFQQADISNVLRLIAEVSGFNMVVGEGVKSKVTMKLVSVPWDQALDMILKMNGLGKIRQSNILWIDSLANIAKQQGEEAQALDAKVRAEPLVERVFYIRNLQATELLTALRQYLSPRGLMQQSQGSNALVVRDTASGPNRSEDRPG
jgi:type IV pilus assembly protein PilQ